MKFKRKFMNSTYLHDDCIKRDTRCILCGSDENLTVHHICGVDDYPFLTIDLDNTICLCRSCHRDYHTKYSDITPHTWTQYLLKRKHNMTEFIATKDKEDLINNDMSITMITTLHRYNMNYERLRQYLLEHYYTTESEINKTFNKLLNNGRIMDLPDSDVLRVVDG